MKLKERLREQKRKAEEVKQANERFQQQLDEQRQRHVDLLREQEQAAAWDRQQAALLGGQGGSSERRQEQQPRQPQPQQPPEAATRGALDITAARIFALENAVIQREERDLGLREARQAGYWDAGESATDAFVTAEARSATTASLSVRTRHSMTRRLPCAMC
jgi:hypothetical protein